MLAASAVAASPALRLKGEPYGQARARLLKLGFEPVRFARTPDFDPCRYADDCDRYPEVLSCSGTGVAVCQFAFFDRHQRRYILITTYGEEKRRVESVTPASPRERAFWPRQVR